MSESKEKIDAIVELCLDLQTREQSLEKMKTEVKELRSNILDAMESGIDGEVIDFVDLPEMLRVSIVEYVRESVSTEAIPQIKELITDEQQVVIIKTKEFVDKGGIKLLRGLLSETQVLEVLSLSPVKYIKFTDREK